ncbi:cytochrome C oxidase subunit IV family protein [Brevibacillus migulae]|uniref:cytochrome C oxidase subunit IV family protein n=1 Tax=Brevibacillus migulae TaxID=1644114 RepID=UPI00106EA332|nr:cytochrome C oxidase subunit IV family protein [Brevibacillus migulae]
MAQVSNDAMERKPKIKKDGVKPHIVTFIASIILTIIAFMATAYEVIPAGFTVPFIIILAIVQAAFQLLVWMHMDQKGHEFARVGIVTGSAVVLVTIIAFVTTLW